MGRRNVTKLTRERAFYSIKIVATAMLNNELGLSYSELANRLQMPNETGQGLGPILDEAAAMCLENSLPDISAVVVTKSSLEKGAPMPSLGSFDDGVWRITGLAIEEIPQEQQRVRDYDWKSVKSLKLA